MNNENKRLFFAFEVHSPWPKSLPKGRILRERDRHLTVAFLGDVDWQKLKDILPEIPLPRIRVGMVGEFDKNLFLPSRRPNVVAWQVKWWEETLNLHAYQKELADWLKKNDFTIRLYKEGFLPHVTLCRHPFPFAEWKKAFIPLPLHIGHLHLYESVGNLIYEPIWTHSIQAPYTHDAVFAESEEQLQLHAKAWSAYYRQSTVPILTSIQQDEGIYSSQVK